MAVIEIKKEDKEKVFEVLINNGLFRSLSKNRFDVVENSEEVFIELKRKKIGFKTIENGE